MTGFAPPSINNNNNNNNNHNNGGNNHQLKVANGEVSITSSSSHSSSREFEETNTAIDYASMTTLPRHPTNDEANDILSDTERALRSMQEKVLFYTAHEIEGSSDATSSYEAEEEMEQEIPVDIEQESVYANSYVDLGKVDTVGFDFDYTLVTYTKELLELIYDMALTRLVEEKEYPREMLSAGLKFDPFFSIRGK